mmetsp:Transcript_40850/g.30068  ORF Transcript_40850/g.30068 Transcript_40850/m.30068 type:complete len:109 (+) Transcript_40850:3006-3332(+)
MASVPYNIHYLPIVAPADRLLDAGDEDRLKQDFLANCGLNIDNWSFKDLSKYNEHYLEELISTAPQTENSKLKGLAERLSYFRAQGMKKRSQANEGDIPESLAREDSI